MQNTPPISAEPRPSVQPSGFVPVAVDTLVSSAAYDFDLFMRQPRHDTYILYRARGYPLTKEDLDRLVQRGVHTLHIAFEDRDSYTESLNHLLLEGGALSPIQKYNLLKGAARSLFSDALCESLPESFIDSADALSRKMVSSICNDELVLRDMFFLMAHDYCSYTHATNVATYSLALAMERGIRGADDLIAIASGALLHDIGKRHLAPALLQKTATLSPEERARIRQHPQLGFQELCFRPGISWGQLMMVYQHHERLDGTGYPVQVAEDEIHLWAKICAVADVFDALTSERPYRRAASPSAALRYLSQRASKAFDQEIVRCLIHMLPNN